MAAVAQTQLLVQRWTVPTSAEREVGGMTPLSLKLNVRGHRFQMRHYCNCAGGPLMGWRFKAAFFAYFLCRGKESRCRPAQGQR
jgi:hypothetical protein